MRYYGFMVSELDGNIEDLEGNFDWKPSHESCGFSFAKWFTNIIDRDESKKYIKQEIKNRKSSKKFRS